MHNHLNTHKLTCASFGEYSRYFSSPGSTVPPSHSWHLPASHCTFRSLPPPVTGEKNFQLTKCYGSDGKESACDQETPIWSLGQEDSLEERMATHSSILAWRIPWTEEPGGLQFMWSQSQTRLNNYHFLFHFMLLSTCSLVARRISCPVPCTWIHKHAETTDHLSRFSDPTCHPSIHGRLMGSLLLLLFSSQVVSNSLRPHGL